MYLSTTSLSATRSGMPLTGEAPPKMTYAPEATQYVAMDSAFSLIHSGARPTAGI